MDKGYGMTNEGYEVDETFNFFENWINFEYSQMIFIFLTT